MGRRPDLVGGGLVRSAGGWTVLKEFRKTDARVASDERILGSSGFVNSVLTAAREGYEKRTSAVAKGLGIESLVGAAGDRPGVECAP